jgi:hypothetical protein
VLGPRRDALVDAASTAACSSAQAVSIAEYESLWRTSFAHRLRVAGAFAHIAMRPWAAAALWPLLQRWPGVLGRGARWSGKTRCVAQAARLAAAIR